MPIKSGRLTPQERQFAKHFAQTADPVYSATKAGYNSPQQRASQNLAKPAVVEEVRRAAREILSNGALVAAQVLVDIAGDASQPAGARVNACDKLIRHAGLSASVEEDADIGSMSLAELQKRAAQLRILNDAVDRERADRSRPVIDHVVGSGPEPPSSIFS